MSRRLKRRQRGFTLVELLVVILIISVLMSVALPLYLSVLLQARQRVCRSNLQTIANTVVAARVKNGASDFSGWNGTSVAFLVSSTPDKVPDITTVPICPNCGTYTIAQGNSGDNTTFKVVCNVGTHGTYQPGIDSN